jgi:hypothetical protein
MTDRMEDPNKHPISKRIISPASRSQPCLRHPTLDKTENITNWLQRSCPLAMSPPSETHSDDLGSLGESGYDFIDTDEESRGAGTESITSDFGRPDDVASLADTEQSFIEDSESERSHATGGIPAFTGLDGPTHTPTMSRTEAGFIEDGDRTMAHSIEFEEPLSIGDENVSVKHTVADFDEESTARIAQKMVLQDPPKRLVATIRQTMTRQGLSTREPLRILYVGCHTAKQDIIRKIASSVAASVGNGRNSVLPGHRSSQLFHVVPITAFGSEKPPEIELMQSSGYQIKVEDCLDAINVKFEDNSEKPDVLKIFLDDDDCYQSIPDGMGFKVHPTWEIPHVAVFYCSENDTVEMRKVRTIAKTFMTRHKVPSIVISHKQLFDKPFAGMALDQHAIHMCLESRDPNGPRNIIHQRLPIDLDSFKTIDARQMNRNLAFLTGLHEPLDTPVASVATSKVVPPPTALDIEKTSYSLGESVSFLRRPRTGAEWRALLPVGFFLFSVFAIVFTGSWKYRIAGNHTVSINGNPTFTEPTSSISTTAMTPTLEGPTSHITSTSTMTHTATKTITVVQSGSPVVNGLALQPPMELVPVIEEKSTVCTAEILGDREILIRIPEATKLSWLTKEALSLNVSRENEKVEPERVYTTVDGIILQLARDEAYGVLNISIVTTRKPKINEIFGVDFGPDWTHDFKGLFWARLHDQVQTTSSLINNTVSRWRKYAEKAIFQSDFLTELTRQRLEGVNKLAADQAVESSKQYTETAKGFSLKLAKWSAILSKEVGMQINEAQNRIVRIREEFHALQNHPVREPFDSVLVRAQVRSRLYWLKLRGKYVEYREYEQRAAEATKRRSEDGARAQLKTEEQTRKMDKAAKRAKKSCHKKSKTGCRS